VSLTVRLFKSETIIEGLPDSLRNGVSCKYFLYFKIVSVTSAYQEGVGRESKLLCPLFDRSYDYCQNCEYPFRVLQAPFQCRWNPKETINRLISIGLYSSVRKCINGLAERLARSDAGAVAGELDALADRCLTCQLTLLFIEDVRPLTIASAEPDQPLVNSGGERIAPRLDNLLGHSIA
jgi:hypothetical protein